MLYLGADSSEPVSYTHLDVYKRQAFKGVAQYAVAVPLVTAVGAGNVPFLGCLLYTSRCV